jgi:hypothetical protein
MVFHWFDRVKINLKTSEVDSVSPELELVRIEVMPFLPYKSSQRPWRRMNPPIYQPSRGRRLRTLFCWGYHLQSHRIFFMCIHLQMLRIP